KTPLNTIVGYTGLMENTSLSEKQHHYINQIHSGSEYVSKLVNDLLDFSKLEAGKLKMESVPFSLENLLQQTTETYRDIYSEKKVELLVTIDPYLQNRVFESDPLRMQQILNNLVGNAFKFTETGSIELKASLLKARKKSVRVKIDVIDTGIGISEEKQQLIFKEFTQAEADTAKKFGGYGLGLAISKKLASLLDGSLKVESKPGEGSTFTLQIPLKKSDRTVRNSTKTSETAFKNLKAIVFDDDPAMRTMLSELFGQMNIEIRDFEKYSTFEKGEKTDFDFVLTDIQMPTTSGFEILENFKKGAINNYNNQPIIAMTGSREHTRKAYFDKGFAEVLQKPFTKNDLVSVLEKVLPSSISSVKKQSNSSETVTTPQPAQPARQEKSDLYDLSLLRSFLETDEALNDVLEVFYTQTKKDMVELKSFIEGKNREEVSQTAHRMLTMCRQISAHKVIPILEALETIPEEEKSNLAPLYKGLQLEIKKLLTALQQNH
uniref:ATP-binding response regulator n=1 Tax=uncultured Marixanthomonas sp. TaxID=757245 RepID=UPI0030D84C19